MRAAKYPCLGFPAWNVSDSGGEMQICFSWTSMQASPTAVDFLTHLVVFNTNTVQSVLLNKKLFVGHVSLHQRELRCTVYGSIS